MVMSTPGPTAIALPPAAAKPERLLLGEVKRLISISLSELQTTDQTSRQSACSDLSAEGGSFAVADSPAAAAQSRCQSVRHRASRSYHATLSAGPLCVFGPRFSATVKRIRRRARPPSATGSGL